MLHATKICDESEKRNQDKLWPDWLLSLYAVFTLTDSPQRYMIMEYCVGELQEMLDNTEQHKFPIWQAHG